MKRLGTILFFCGSAALLWCAIVLGGAALLDRYEIWKLGRTPAAMDFHRGGLKPYALIGRIEIPRLRISTVVLEGDDDSTLRFGAGHIPQTPLPGNGGNVGIAAHRDTFFRALKGVAPQDRITLTTPDGIYQYSVESTEIVGPSQTGVLASSSVSELTLVTCYPFEFIGSAPLRFVVHARRIPSTSRGLT